jgi:hypothetical protein
MKTNFNLSDFFKYPVLLFLFSFPGRSISQTLFLKNEIVSFADQHRVDAELVRFLEEQPEFSSLNDKEKAFFYWFNLFRKDPRGFGEKLIKPYLVTEPKFNNRFARSLFKDLSSSPDQFPLVLPSRTLHKMSADHCLDLYRNEGRLSHKSSSGKSFSDRVGDIDDLSCACENLFAGQSTSLEALILLLIDSGIESVGHRKNLMDGHMERMGVSVRLSGNEILLVQDLGCKNPCKK